MTVASDAEIREILGLQTVAAVGCSPTPGDDTHEVPKYLLEHGYEVVPVTRDADEILGRSAHDALADVEATVDVVDVLGTDGAADAVDAALERDDVKVIWFQPGVADDGAADRAEAAGKRVVRHKCLRIEHQRLV